VIAVLRTLRRLLASNGGATALEYGLSAALIAVAAIGGMSALGSGSGGMWEGIKDKVLAVM
jgi:pilus assembly protein Flp/PilA